MSKRILVLIALAVTVASVTWALSDIEFMPYGFVVMFTIAFLLATINNKYEDIDCSEIKNHIEVPNKYIFRKSGITIIILAMNLYIWLFQFTDNTIILLFVFMIISLLLNGTITELYLKDDKVIINNILRVSYDVPYRRIWVFGKTWGRENFYIIILKGRIFPVRFESAGGAESIQRIQELIGRLEEKTSKEKDVIF